jgi:hypothetical protein
MKIPSNNFKIIFIFGIAIFLMGLYLFNFERNNQDVQYKKDWTVAYLTEPQEKSLNFTIENYEGKEMFYEYSILAKENQKIILTEGINLLPNQKKEIEFEKEQAGESIIIKYADNEIVLKRP